MRILISSTGTDLTDYRAAAIEVCNDWGHKAVVMEDIAEFTPSKTSPEAACRDAVATCQLVVVLVAYRYGTPVPGEDRSYTELEYDTAMSLPHVGLQGWLMHEDHPWPPSLVDRGESWDRIERFRSKVSSGHLTGFFGDLEKFKRELGIAIQASAGDAPEDAVPPAPVRAPAPFASPAYIGSMEFIGRAEETAWLDNWVSSPRPVAIIDAIGGTGKSALTWAWWDDPAQETHAWSGRFWWSFYERNNTLPLMIRTFLSYCGLPTAEDDDDVTLAQRVLSELSTRPYLLVLDGVERLLDGYLRADADSVGEDALERLDTEEARRVTDPASYRFLEQLLGVRGSRILMSTRLVPDVFISLGGRLREGAVRLPLRGLSDGDLLRLLARLEISGIAAARDFLALLGNHPLLVKIILGQVRDHRPAPGDFDAWLADPSAGGAFSLASLSLTERSHHILEQSLARLDPLELRLLQRLVVPYGFTDWALINALNPYHPGAADAVQWEGLPPWLGQHVAQRLKDRTASERPTPALVEAERQLVASLQRLEDLGLLWWERETNLYDMHPVVRAHVRDTLAPEDERRTHGIVADHFGFSDRDWDASVLGSMTDDGRIAAFLACVGAGWIPTAARIWYFDDWGHHMVWRDGQHALAVMLLRALVTRIGEAVHPGLEVDLAVAEERLGHVQSAMHRSARILARSVATPSNADSVCVHLVNLCSSAEECGEARVVEVGQALLDELQPLVPTDAARARPFLQAASNAWAGNDPRACLAAVERALLVAPNPYDPEWHGTLENLRLSSLVALGEWEEVGVPQIDQPRFGTTWFSRRDWARFCWEVAVERDDHAAALSAAHELDLWRRQGGTESFRQEEAVALAMAGRTTEARALIDDALLAIERVHPNQRPHLDLGRALALLGDPRAVEQARTAFRQACARSTGHDVRLDVDNAENLLRDIGAPVPERVPGSSATAAPLPEGELRSYIQAVRRGEIPLVHPDHED